MGEKLYIRGRQQYGECNTLLPELAATEVAKCFLYQWRIEDLQTGAKVERVLCFKHFTIY